MTGSLQDNTHLRLGLPAFASALYACFLHAAWVVNTYTCAVVLRPCFAWGPTVFYRVRVASIGHMGVCDCLGLDSAMLLPSMWEKQQPLRRE